MGRRPWTARFTVEECDALSVATLCRAGVFRLPLGSVLNLSADANHYHGRVEWSATISRPSNDEWTLSVWQSATPPLPVVRFTIRIVRVPCNFGGNRYLFLCPQIRDGRLICRRRATKLFCPPGQTSFGCRQCFNLTYKSVQQHDQRVDNLARDLDLLHFVLRSGNVKLGLLAVRAHLKILTQLKRSPRSVQRTLSRLAENYRYNPGGLNGAQT
jgi:hypothetical protein